MISNPIKIKGYEKFWNALFAGNIAQVPIVVTTILVANLMGPEYSDMLPGKEVVIGCIGIFWGSLFGAIGAYLATNSPVDNPVTGTPEVQVSLPVEAETSAQGELLL